MPPIVNAKILALFSLFNSVSNRGKKLFVINIIICKSAYPPPPKKRKTPFRNERGDGARSSGILALLICYCLFFKIDSILGVLEVA